MGDEEEAGDFFKGWMEITTKCGLKVAAPFKGDFEETRHTMPVLPITWNEEDLQEFGVAIAGHHERIMQRNEDKHTEDIKLLAMRETSKEKIGEFEKKIKALNGMISSKESILSEIRKTYTTTKNYVEILEKTNKAQEASIAQLQTELQKALAAINLQRDQPMAIQTREGASPQTICTLTATYHEEKGASPQRTESGIRPIDQTANPQTAPNSTGQRSAKGTSPETKKKANPQETIDELRREVERLSKKDHYAFRQINRLEKTIRNDSDYNKGGYQNARGRGQRGRASYHHQDRRDYQEDRYKNARDNYHHQDDHHNDSRDHRSQRNDRYESRDRRQREDSPYANRHGIKDNRDSQRDNHRSNQRDDRDNSHPLERVKRRENVEEAETVPKKPIITVTETDTPTEKWMNQISSFFSNLTSTVTPQTQPFQGTTATPQTQPFQGIAAAPQTQPFQGPIAAPQAKPAYAPVNYGQQNPQYYPQQYNCHHQYYWSVTIW